MSWRVPLSTLPMPEEDVEAVIECLEQGWLTMGPRTMALEVALADYLGAEHVVTVSSGTAALHLACLAAGLGPGGRQQREAQPGGQDRGGGRSLNGTARDASAHAAWEAEVWVRRA